MEFSRLSDLHFIQAAQGGLLVKTLNVTCGRPALKFKKLTDIKDEIEGLVFDSSGLKVESPSMTSGGKGIIKSDPKASEFSCSGGGDNGRNSVMEDLDFGYMTLKQLKEICKENKRKHSECIDLNRETDKKCSRVKQKYSNVKSDEDELDLREPLRSWKSKLAKNKKAKSECLKKRVFAPFRSSSSVIKSEDIPSLQDFLHSKGDFSAPTDIRKEVLELVDCSDYENSSSLISDNQPGPCGIVLKEVPEIAAECILGTQAEDPQICVVNEAYNEYVNNCSTESVHTVNASCDINKVDDPEIISQNLSVSEAKGKEYVTNPICDDLFQEPISSTNDHSYGMHDDHQSFSINHEMQWQIDSDCVVQVPDMTAYNFGLFVEASGSDACSLEDDSRGDLPSNLETNALHGSVGHCSLGSNHCLVSSAGDSPMAEEKESQRTDCGVDAERNCFSGILYHDASKEFTTTVDAGFDDSSELKCPPKRLFPTRKAISSSSQEKLCKAMESVELHDEEHYGDKKKLCFAKETESKNKIHRNEGLDQVRRIRYSIKPKHIVMNKTKDEKRDSRPKGIPKVPKLSPAVPHTSTECTSIQRCSQNAIAFSERQMQDIECLATKLRNELKTMKEIAEERLWSEEAYPTTSLKYDASKVRMAIKNVTRAEQSAQRWISMMARDCSRFCKIMKLTETDSVAPKSVVIKVRKKVTFADEAGEKLCQNFVV